MCRRAARVHSSPPSLFSNKTLDSKQSNSRPSPCLQPYLTKNTICGGAMGWKLRPHPGRWQMQRAKRDDEHVCQFAASTKMRCFVTRNISLFVCGPTRISIFISSLVLFLINPYTLFSLSPSLPMSAFLSAFWCPSLSDLIWEDIKDGWMSMASCAGVVVHTSVPLWQAMYQLAPDEKRRDCGLNVLDTYFNNGVRRTHTHLITELADTDIRNDPDICLRSYLLTFAKVHLKSSGCSSYWIEYIKL